MVDSPSHGTLEGTPPELTYVPAGSHLGEDSFTFTVASGSNTSEPATVRIFVAHHPFYAITRGNEERTSKLYYYEKGAPTLVGDTGHAIITIKFDPTDGTLYGATRSDDFEDLCNNCLVTLDTTTGAATAVGMMHEAEDEETGIGPTPSIVFTSAGDLFGWTEAGDDPIAIDKTTGEVEYLNSGVSSYGHAMWPDEADTLWFFNGDGYVYTVDGETGEQELIYEGEEFAEAAEVTYEGDFTVRGDRNPSSGEYWGVAPGYGYIPASAIMRLYVTADTLEYRGLLSAESVPGIHNLAFSR